MLFKIDSLLLAVTAVVAMSNFVEAHSNPTRQGHDVLGLRRMNTVELEQREVARRFKVERKKQRRDRRNRTNNFGGGDHARGSAGSSSGSGRPWHGSSSGHDQWSAAGSQASSTSSSYSTGASTATFVENNVQLAGARSSSTAATTRSSSSAAAATTTAASSTSSSTTFSGEATYYTQDGGTGACGNVFPDTAFIVALNVAQYGDTGSTSSYCGQTVVITNTANSKSTTATIQDACPGCSADSLDLSVAAFEAIGSLDTGVLSITWYISS